MARPKKQTIDYFPHACDHGKTMFILEQKYGNDGYSLWFKLLEILGKTEGHFLDCNNEASWEFLQAKTKLPGEICLEILDLLAKLDALDRELWAIKVVWSQNFVDGVADVYKNRRAEIPKRPGFYIQKPPVIDVSTDENPQSKVKESKVEESKVEESKRDIGVILRHYSRNISAVPTWMEQQTIKAWFDEDVSPCLMEWAIEQAAYLNGRNIKYVDTIIRKKTEAGITTRKQAEAYEAIRKAKKEGKEPVLPTINDTPILTEEQIRRSEELDRILLEEGEE